MNNLKDIKFLVGTDSDGDEVFGSFQQTGHFISAGHVGSGHASYDEGVFVAYLLQNYSPEELQLVMIDPKFVQLTPYKEIPYLWRPLAHRPEEVRVVVSDLLREMDNRYADFAAAGVENITEFNAQTTEKLPFIILLCTEIADLMMLDGEYYVQSFSALALHADAAGIHLYLATQRPSKNILPDNILEKISGRLIFAVSSEIDSKRLLGRSGAEKISEQGRLIYADLIDNTFKTVQAPLISHGDIVNIVKIVSEKH